MKTKKERDREERDRDRLRVPSERARKTIPASDPLLFPARARARQRASGRELNIINTKDSLDRERFAD